MPLLSTLAVIVEVLPLCGLVIALVDHLRDVGTQIDRSTAVSCNRNKIRSHSTLSIDYRPGRHAWSATRAPLHVNDCPATALPRTCSFVCGVSSGIAPYHQAVIDEVLQHADGEAKGHGNLLVHCVHMPDLF